ncbi:MAG: ABC transporter ATP-binding protein [Firmicutes bacterium]|nr:ABC transporter ATP-binding protein [Bacillota bacterium]
MSTPITPAICVESLTRRFRRTAARRKAWQILFRGERRQDAPPSAQEGRTIAPSAQGCGQNGHALGPEEFWALAGIDLEVRSGELFGLLGPNGAGKTTLIKILATLLAPTSGRAWVAGYDVVSDPYSVRRHINMVSGGETSGYGILTVEENLWLFSQLYGIPTAVARPRIRRLLQVVQLEDKAKSKMNSLSTGQRQKLNFCRGFLSDPDVLFLDEPTLGLDITAARSIRAFVREWMQERPGRTVLLTTHYLAEAEELCDRIAIIDHGRILACGSPADLKSRLELGVELILQVLTPDRSPKSGVRGEQIQEMLQAAGRAVPGLRQLNVTLPDAAAGLSEGGRPVSVAGDDRGPTPGTREKGATVRMLPLSPAGAPIQIQAWLQSEPAAGEFLRQLALAGITLVGIEKREPTLEDVFLHWVGTEPPPAPAETAAGR